MMKNLHCILFGGLSHKGGEDCIWVSFDAYAEPEGLWANRSNKAQSLWGNLKIKKRFQATHMHLPNCNHGRYRPTIS